MKNNKHYFFLGLMLTVFLLLACQNENPISISETDSFLKSSIEQSDFPPGELSQEERDGLIHMRIEEKLARDVYIVIGELWNYKVFLNIQLSEQKHMEAVKKLLDRYTVPDPLTTDSIGVFPNPQFQQLYDNYIQQGNQSLQQALLAGKAIEELDIADLEYQLSFVDNPDIIKVYQNLKAASENHLVAFNKCLIQPTFE